MEMVVYPLKSWWKTCSNEYAYARKYITNTNVLILYECLKISAEMVDTIELICRKVRNCQLFFGGLHIIFAGDIYQLPPVANELIGDDGSFCIF